MAKKRGSSELAQALAWTGGAAGLAARAGVRPAQIGVWQRRGVPRRHAPLVAALAEEQALREHWSSAQKSEQDREVLIIAERMTGGRAKLAKALGVQEPTVKGYYKRGVPKSRRDEIYDLAGELPPPPEPPKPKPPKAPTLRDLKSLVNREGVTKAARQLGVSPSTIRANLQRGRLSDKVKRGFVVVKSAKRSEALAKEAAEENLLHMLELRQGEEAPIAARLRDALSQLKSVRAQIDAVYAKSRRRRMSAVMRRELQRQLEELRTLRDQLVEDSRRLRARLDIPLVRGGAFRYEGVSARGIRYVKKWSLALFEEDDTIPLEEWFRSLKRRYPYWQAVTTMLQYDTTGKGKVDPVSGYPMGFVQLPQGEKNPFPDPKTDYFTTAHVPSKRSTRRDEVADDMIERIVSLLDAGYMIQVLGTTMRNYELRTREEQLTWQAEKRRRRRKKSGLSRARRR